jgi:hypothetical protein
MEFSASSTNLTELLVACLAVVAAWLLLRKRYDSNMPLLFYFAVIMFNSMTEREVNPYLLYTGVVLAMLLRFEFMGTSFAKVVAMFSTAALCIINLTRLVGRDDLRRGTDLHHAAVIQPKRSLAQHRDERE